MTEGTEDGKEGNRRGEEPERRRNERETKRRGNGANWAAKRRREAPALGHLSPYQNRSLSVCLCTNMIYILFWREITIKLLCTLQKMEHGEGDSIHERLPVWRSRATTIQIVALESALRVLSRAANLKNVKVTQSYEFHRLRNRVNWAGNEYRRVST